jgi:hypothetical protein
VPSKEAQKHRQEISMTLNIFHKEMGPFWRSFAQNLTPVLTTRHSNQKYRKESNSEA